jgi:PAS domain S-box-containing protein
MEKNRKTAALARKRDSSPSNTSLMRPDALRPRSAPVGPKSHRESNSGPNGSHRIAANKLQEAIQKYSVLYEAIRQSEERFRTLFELVPVAVYACDADGLIEEYNQHAVELWGQDPGRSGSSSRFCGSYRIYYPDGRLMPHRKCPTARALRGEKLDPKDADIIVERPNGERRNVTVLPRILRDSRGKVVGAINCLYEMTQRKQAEALALRLAAVVQSSHDAIAAKDLNGIITDWNKSAERIFGYTREEVIGKSILMLIPPERRSEEVNILSRVRRGQSLDHYETVRQRKDGTLIDVSLTISPIKDSKGKIVGVSKIARDITKQKKVERQLAEQARLLDLTKDAIIVRDANDRILFWNKGAEELYGYASEEALGQVTHDLLKTEFPERRANIFKRLDREKHWEGELIQHRRDRKRLTTLSRWSIDVDARGKRRGILESNTDITDRKTAEAELLRSKQMLEELVEQRTAALSKANTELENEITRRRGLEGQILEISDREQQRLAQELHDGLCQQLTGIGFMARAIALRVKNHRVLDPADMDQIAALVNAAATTARNISRALHRVDVDAAGLVDTLQNLATREIWKTPCRLEVKQSFQINDDVAALNLYGIAREAVVNANKHACAREIVIQLARSKNDIVLSVADDGVGMKREQDKSRGLGFHIMNYRARAVGGRLKVESQRNGGTRVSCYIPLPT